jgi:hypothetical protein
MHDDQPPLQLIHQGDLYKVFPNGDIECYPGKLNILPTEMSWDELDAELQTKIENKLLGKEPIQTFETDLDEEDEDE